MHGVVKTWRFRTLVPISISKHQPRTTVSFSNSLLLLRIHIVLQRLLYVYDVTILKAGTIFLECIFDTWSVNVFADPKKRK